MLLGLLIMLTPQSIFPVCEQTIATASGAAVPMKCFWTARAAYGVGGLIVVAGLMLAFTGLPGVRLGIAAMLLFTSLLSGLMPTELIGVCAGVMMPCHMGTLPALALLSLFTGLAALGVAWAAWKELLFNRRIIKRENRRTTAAGRGGGKMDTAYEQTDTI